MGWLFAVAIGLHRQSERLIFVALLPIALGHFLAICTAVALMMFVGTLVDLSVLSIGTGGMLIVWALWLFAYGHRHPVRIGMTTGLIGLGLWSFIMALAHGSGLMILPALLPLQNAHDHVHGTVAGSVSLAMAAVTIHTAAMLVSTGVMAFVVYRWIGLSILKRAWINFDLIWAGVLLLGGLVSIWIAVQDLPVQKQEIKGKHHLLVGALSMGGRQGGEVRHTILVLDNDLAVDQSGMALELPAGVDHSAVLVRPVTAAASEGSGVATVDPKQGSEGPSCLIS